MHIAGHIALSTQYRLPSKCDSTALKLGSNYVIAEQILSAIDVNSSHVYILSYVYDVINFGEVSNFKLAHKQCTKTLHKLCWSAHPCMHLDVGGNIIFPDLESSCHFACIFVILVGKLQPNFIDCKSSINVSVIWTCQARMQDSPLGTLEASQTSA